MSTCLSVPVLSPCRDMGLCPSIFLCLGTGGALYKSTFQPACIGWRSDCVCGYVSLSICVSLRFISRRITSSNHLCAGDFGWKSLYWFWNNVLKGCHFSSQSCRKTSQYSRPSLCLSSCLLQSLTFMPCLLKHLPVFLLFVFFLHLFLLQLLTNHFFQVTFVFSIFIPLVTVTGTSVWFYNILSSGFHFMCVLFSAMTNFFCSETDVSGFLSLSIFIMLFCYCAY